MTDMKKAALITAAAVTGLYALAVRGRTGHPGLQALKGWRYAHRGLHGNGIPENSMAAFRAALEHSFGIELDVHLLKDGTLAIMHDHDLKRTTGLEGKIEDLTARDLPNCFLEGTQETVPTFAQVLELYAGKAPLIVELKAVGSNYAALAEAACDMLKSYDGVYCLESFDPRVVNWLKNNRPHLIRGQLTENFIAGKGPLPMPIKIMLTTQLENFVIQPDFVAFKYIDRKNPGNFLVRRLWGIQGVTWTVKTLEDLATAEKEGYIPIFEGFVPDGKV